MEGRGSSGRGGQAGVRVNLNSAAVGNLGWPMATPRSESEGKE